MLKIVLGALGISFLAPVGWASAVAEQDTDAAYRQLEMRRLFEPSQAELAREAEGSVYIYEGLTDHAVAQAMDDEFHRLDSMMFVNTVRSDPQGRPKRDPETGYVVADHDCD